MQRTIRNYVGRAVALLAVGIVMIAGFFVATTPSTSTRLSEEVTNQVVEDAPAVVPETSPAEPAMDLTPELQEVADCGGGTPGLQNSSQYTVRVNGYLDGCTNLTTDLPPGMQAASNFDSEYLYTARCNAITIEIWRTKADGSGAYLYAKRTLTWYNSNGAGWHGLVYPESYNITGVIPGPC